MAMSLDLTKTQRRRIRELAGLAHERELSAELAKVEAAFKRWRAGELDAFELSEAIHEFHQGPSRELYSLYEPAHLDVVVAGAIHRGVISPEEAGGDIMEALGRLLAGYRSQTQ
jgi:hypothetical protein